jgi:hypothetical protein
LLPKKVIALEKTQFAPPGTRAKLQRSYSEGRQMAENWKSAKDGMSCGYKDQTGQWLFQQRHLMPCRSNDFFILLVARGANGFWAANMIP